MQVAAEGLLVLIADAMGEATAEAVTPAARAQLGLAGPAGQ